MQHFSLESIPMAAYRPHGEGSPGDEIHPALDPSITTVPVTPGISAEGGSSYEQKHPKTMGHGEAPLWNANSYFSPKPGDPQDTPSSPSEVAKGARTGAELLRRLSLIDITKTDEADVDPRAQHPGLHLSGRVISANFTIPYNVGLRFGSDWRLSSRRGTSALFDNFSHLSSRRVPWKHTLVGWTGEIGPVLDSLSPPQSPSVDGCVESRPGTSSSAKKSSIPINKSSAPIPVDGSARKPLPSTSPEGLRITKNDRSRLEAQLHENQEGQIVPVWLADSFDEESGDMFLKDQGRWRRYGENDLYTLFHYKQNGPTDGRSERARWADYYRMNQQFADKIVEIYRPGDIVWIHDYHLFLLPNLLRQRLPNIYIGFFLHIPFPSSEFLRCLTRRKDILTGVLGANMIGFQSFSYSRHFSSCCTRILGFDSTSAGVDAYGAHVAVDVFPIGIDAREVQRCAYTDQIVDQNIAGIKKLYAGKKIIVGRDRLDPVRGVAQKLMAFELFLERYPEWRDKAVLIQVTSPTSVADQDGEESGNKISNQISELVSKINGMYGSLSFSPVQHYPQYLSQQEYFALLRVADLGLITSVRDGMNTTSLEYVVCQREKHSPLILSEFSGTAGSLSAATHINPWDLGGVARSIDEALRMSPEAKKTQHEKLYKHVTTNTVQTWSNNYLRRLLTNLSSFDQSIATPALDKTKMLKQYRKARKRLFMFDYDGTLTPIVKDPQAAIPSDRVIRTIKSLAADPKNAVWIISGRDQGFLDEWMGHISELGLSAEHGCFIRQPRDDDWENLTEKFNMGWQKEVMEIFQHYTERTQGSFIERKRVALTWHYRRADPEYGAFQAKECKKHLENTVAKKWEVEVMSGKANLEVRPTFVNKGFIAKRLVDEYGSGEGEPPEFVLCLGDDFTDEDMFRALRKTKLPESTVYSVTVGASSKQTAASWHLLEPSDVIATIGLLNSLEEADSGLEAEMGLGTNGVVGEGRFPDTRL